jgi:hypothetical protein
MRSLILASALAALFMAPGFAPPAFAGDEAQIEKVDHRRSHGRWGYGPDCRELRRACMYKRELREEGRGNCERYRRLCG